MATILPLEIARGQELLALADDNIERFRKSNAQVKFQTSSGAPAKAITVKVRQQSQDFLFGNLIFDLVWGDAPYKAELFKRRFLELFNMAIFPFYWSTYEPEAGKVQAHRSGAALEWCRANGVTPKGHPLVWPYTAGVPEWLYDMPEETIETLIQARVTNLVKGFAPQIDIWDVTNEAVNHISWAEAVSKEFAPHYHDVSLWRGIDVAGAFKREISIREAADWVEKSFRWAYAANPRATLIVNDYNQIVDPHIRQRFFDLVRELQDRGAPVSGIGLQAHPVDHWLWPQAVYETLDQYAGLQVPIHITELHQPSWDHPIEGGWRDGAWNEERQAEFMDQLYRQFFGHPAVATINYWGLSDRNIWIEGAGLVDAEYRPKPVFKALKRLIKEKWMTPELTLVTDELGEISFRGFHGVYSVEALQPGKKTAVWEMHVAPDEANRREFILA